MTSLNTMHRLPRSAGTILLAYAMTAQQVLAVGVAVTPASASRLANGSVQFAAMVSGSTNAKVAWLVNGVPGGAPSIGTISTAGLYVAPADVAKPITVKVAAVASADPLATGTASVGVAASTWSGPIYHVATTGNDANNGSAATPWRTIQHAVGVVPAGGTVLVHGGVYREAVTITRSGNPTAGYITVASVPGQTATLDGTGLAIANGKQGLFTLFNTSYVRVIGFEVRNYRTSKASEVPMGIFVYGLGNHVELRNNHIHDIVTTVATSAGDAFGLAIYGTTASPINNLIVDGNELDHLVTGYSESLSVNGNVLNWQVTNNKVHDNNNIGIVAIGFEQTAPTASVDQARDGWIAGNLVYNITSKNNPAYNGESSAGGIYVDGGTRITIERNRVHHTDLGIELASEHLSRTTSYVTARNNLVMFSNVTGISIGGYAAAVGGTDHCTVANNTLYGNDTSQSGTGEFQIQFHATGNIFKNNIVYANAQGLLVNSFVNTTTAPAVLDRNLYYTVNGLSAAEWIWNNNSITTLAAFRTASHGEANGLLANPTFASTTAQNLDMHLATGSPGIDSGSNLGLAIEGSWNFDGTARIAGGAIDRGAFER